MRLSSYLIPVAALVAGALFSIISATYAASLVEDYSEIGVRAALDSQGETWAEVEADGLQVILSGTAPNEARRFAALSTAGSVVDAARVIDQLDVTPAQVVAPPRFSVEMLRNDSGVSLMGLVPTGTLPDRVVARLDESTGADTIKDFLETADYAAPENWDAALDFALDALEMLPRAKVSVDATRVEITAIADSAEQKQTWEARLARGVPDGLRLALRISAPRPVITPFTLRFLIDEGGARFDACSADTGAARKIILDAAADAGFAGKATCTLGLGVPSQQWANAVATGIRALAEIGQGSLTFSDADVTLIAAETTSQATFDRVVGELENALPDVFALHSVLTKPAQSGQEGPPEFTATLSPEGQVQLRGRLKDDLARVSTDSFARARFGADAVYSAARLDPELPQGWSVRVLAGLEALSELKNGVLRVTPDNVSVRGNTGNPDASARIAQLLSARLGEAQDYTIDVTYREQLDPVASLPTPEECIASINAILADGKITFEPGSATIEQGARNTMDAIAEVLKECGEIRIEIGGHTDSQGSESMNQQLSQQRAQSVLNELRQRRVLTATYSARGYGESQPIADNGTEQGREDNRRIEFRLLGPEEAAQAESALESSGQSVEEEAGDSAASGETAAQGDTPQEEPADEQN